VVLIAEVSTVVVGTAVVAGADVVVGAAEVSTVVVGTAVVAGADVVVGAAVVAGDASWSDGSVEHAAAIKAAVKPRAMGRKSFMKKA
jgi:hypothetical protein